MFKVFWLSGKDLFDELFLLISVNITWVLINLPFIGLTILFLLSNAIWPAAITFLLLTLTFGPTNAGLYTVAERVVEGRTASIKIFFEGFRQYLKLSWQLYGLWIAGLLLILVNLGFYGGSNVPSPIGPFLLILFLYILLIWFGLLIYIGPLMILQNDKRLRIIARNAFLMTLGRPIFTLLTVILMAIILIVSNFLAILPFLITFSFFGLWGFRATTKLIKDAEDRRAELEAQAAKESGDTRYNAEKGRGGQIRPRD